MPANRTIEESRVTAERANNYVKSFALQSTTHASFSDIDKKRQREILNEFGGPNGHRNDYTAARQYGLGPSPDVNQYNKSLNARDTGIANCQEKAFLALDYIAKNEPDASAEVYSLGSYDHAICVVDRDKASNPKDPSTWGENAHVCDPWADDVYPASELANGRTYQTSHGEHVPLPNDYGNVEIQKTQGHFDPQEHGLDLKKDMNTDMIRKANEAQDPQRLEELYHKKISVIREGLTQFNTDLKAMSTRLSQDSSLLTQQKNQIISAKQERVENELRGSEMNKPMNSVPPSADYVSRRENYETCLKGSLQQARTLAEIHKEEQDVLHKSRNPKLDSILGVTPKSANEYKVAKDRFDCTLDSLEKINLQHPHDTLKSPQQNVTYQPSIPISQSYGTAPAPSEELSSNDEENESIKAHI